MDYIEFLNKKTHSYDDLGFKPLVIHDWLFDFQKHLVEKALVKGRFAIFADTGLGKTAMLLSWADNVHRKTGKNILIATPLAVAKQIEREGDKFGVPCYVTRDGYVNCGINITNYQQLHKYRPTDFVAMVCDESSILKSFDGALKSDITDFMRKMSYRLLVTATPSPNDFIELGTSSEALGYMGNMDMLNMFFKNDQNNSATKKAYRLGQRHSGSFWRFKGHAEMDFWKWVCSWSIAVKKPSDLGFDDGRFLLPELKEIETQVDMSSNPDYPNIDKPLIGLKEQREEKRRTIKERCEKIAELVNHTNDYALVWCDLNDEGDLLEQLIPDAVQVSGKDKDSKKEDKLLEFQTGNSRVLITKPKIASFGLNFQHCNHVTFFPTHSYEQYYQGVRRCWRFGQNRPVHVDIVSTPGDAGILNNLKRKSEQADRMFGNLISSMHNSKSISSINIKNKTRSIPKWI